MRSIVFILFLACILSCEKTNGKIDTSLNGGGGELFNLHPGFLEGIY